MSFDKIACFLTGRRFVYHVKLKYIPDLMNSQNNITQTIMVEFEDRDRKCISRYIRKLAGEGMIKSIPKRYLKNGELQIDRISYLGFLK